MGGATAQRRPCTLYHRNGLPVAGASNRRTEKGRNRVRSMDNICYIITYQNGNRDEGDTTHENAQNSGGAVEADVAAITIGMGEAPVSFTAGKILLPFADFGTELVSDPMAFELSEAHKTVLQIGFESGALAGSVYAFNGDADYGGKDGIGDFGVQADYGIELGGIAFDAGVGWLSDLRESYKAEELRPEGGDWPGDRKKVAGLAVSALCPSPATT